MNIVDAVRRNLENGQLPKLFVERDTIDVTPMEEADPDWKFTDAMGHAFNYRVHADAENSPIVDGIRWVVEAEAAGEYPEIGHYECIACGATVRPGTRSPAYRKYVPGLVTATVDGVSVSEEEFKQVAALVQRHMEK